MKLLIITQKVDKNDDNLGFFHRWLLEFAKYTEQLTVICLQKGEYDLPKNVRVLSLGKDEGRSRLTYLTRLYRYIWKERSNYDTAFVHMNPIYIVLAGICWKMLGKKIALWYTHKRVNLKLRVAEKFADIIFTASQESFRLPSRKVVVTGHGIDIEKFKRGAGKRTDAKGNLLRIITAGRITPVKNLHILIDAAKLLKDKGISFELKIAGRPVTKDDEKYLAKLSGAVRDGALEKEISFIGSVPYSKIETLYQSGDVFVNLSETGSLDKAVLEAMASGISVLTSNEAFFGMLPETHTIRMLTPEELADKLPLAAFADDVPALKNIVSENHSLGHLVRDIMQTIAS